MAVEARIARLEPRLAVLPAFRERSPYTLNGAFSVESLARSRPTTVSAAASLRETEQSVFYALVYLIGRCGHSTDGQVTESKLKQLWSDLMVRTELGGAEWLRAGVLNCSWRELARHAGFAGFGSPVQSSIRSALERLSQTTVERWTMGQRDASRLIAFVAGQEGVAVALEPMSTLVARGAPRADGGIRQYVGVSLDERKAFNDPAARVMHAWLRAWSSSRGKRHVITFDQLETKIWSDQATRSTRSRRRRRLFKMLRELATRLPHWEVSIAADRVSILRSGAGFPIGPGSVELARRRSSDCVKQRHGLDSP